MWTNSSKGPSKTKLGFPSVTFETKCWENDWEILMKTGRLKRMIERSRFPFKEKILYINNVNNKIRVEKAAEELVKKGIITSAVFVDGMADKVLDFFSIDKDSFKGGYYYSIQELAGIFNCKTDYLLHFSGDTIMGDGAEWIGESINRMESDREILVANPNWQRSGDMAKQESLSEDGSFYKGFGFSDQCYLVRNADLRKPVYNEKNEVSERYPVYGGELFEKRVDAYMRNHALKRITSKNAYYIHKNFSRNPLKKTFQYALEAVRP